jgi:hypothetical protein
MEVLIMMNKTFTQEQRDLLKSFGRLSELNETLDVKNKIKTVGYTEFCIRNQGSKNLNNLIVLGAEDVDVYISEKKEVVLYYKGWNREFIITCSKGGMAFKRLAGWNDFQLIKVDRQYRQSDNFGLNTSVIVERLVGLICCIVLDELPITFDNLKLEVNLKDLSGNLMTSEHYNIDRFNYSLNNMEWTLKNRNSKHNGSIQALYKRFGTDKYFKISANEIDIIMDYVDTHDDAESLSFVEEVMSYGF